MDTNKEVLLNIGSGKADYDRRSALKLGFDGNLIIQGNIIANNVNINDILQSLQDQINELKNRI